MQKKESNKKRKLKIVPDSNGKATIMLLLLFIEVILFGLLAYLDVLPLRYSLLLLVVIAAADLGISVLLASDSRGLKPLAGLCCAMVMFLLVTTGAYYIISTLDTLSKISVATGEERFGIDITDNSFNIYISGIDFWGDIEDVSRSDVNMIMTVNPKNRQVLLTSIPRDSYVYLHSNHQLDKLTHSGVYGIDETTSTVEDWLGIEVDYYVRANFNMVMALVNAMGGVDVYSDYAFKSSISDYKYKKGWNHVTGKGALYFARERKSFKDSDQQRIKDQQKVVKAIMRKMTSSKVLLTHYTRLLDAVEGYMQTSMSQRELSALVKMQLNDMSGKWTVNSISISGHEEMKGTYSMGFERPLIVNITDKKSEKRATRLINKVKNAKRGEIIKIKDDKSRKNNLKKPLEDDAGTN